ncbi:MAG: aspartyl protease family protein [Hyphomonadaceae bacterium]|nr:aspartyl protease family protein [Hyphomonadaceae bacterium]
MSIWADLRERALALVLAPALLFLGAGAPLDAPTGSPPEPVTMPVALDVAGRVTAEVMVDGQGPFKFLIDTGANRSGISRGLADRLAMPLLPDEIVHTFTGPVASPITRIGLLRVGEVDGVRNALVPVLDGAVLAGADGILGADSLRNRRLVMDMEAGSVRLEEASRRLLGRGWVALPARFQRGNLVIADGEIDGVKAHVIIDTGAQTSFVNMALVQALDRPTRRIAPLLGTRLVSAGRPMRIDNFLFVPKVDVGDLDVHNVAAYAADVHIFDIWGVTREPAIVIGMDVWGRVEGLAIDYQRGKVYVRP